MGKFYDLKYLQKIINFNTVINNFTIIKVYIVLVIITFLIDCAFKFLLIPRQIFFFHRGLNLCGLIHLNRRIIFLDSNAICGKLYFGICIY